MCSARRWTWFVVAALAGAGALPSFTIGASQHLAPPETTASVSLRLDEEGPDTQIENELETIDSLIWKGEYNEAEAKARSTLQILDATGAGQTAAAAAVIDRLVTSLRWLYQAQTDEALELAQRALGLVGELGEESAAAIAQSHLNLAIVYQARQQLDPAESSARQALAVLEAAGGVPAEKVAETKKELGRVYFRKGYYEKALPWFDEAIDTLERANKIMTVEMASVQQARGQCLAALRRPKDALAAIQESIDIYSTLLGPDHPNVGFSLTYRAQIERREFALEEAQGNLTRALAILEAAHGRDSPILFPLLDTLGLTLTTVGEYAAAAEMFERALALSETPTVWNNFGILRASMGDHAEAIRLFDRAILLQEQISPDHPNLAFPVENKGLSLSAQGRFMEAEPLMERALEIRRQAFGAESLFVADSIYNLALLQLDKEDPDAAAQLLAERVAITEALVPEDHYQRAQNLYLESWIAYLREDLEEAVRFGTEALASWQRLLGSGHPTVEEHRQWLATLLGEAGDLLGSCEAALEAEEAMREQLLLAARIFGEGQLLQYAQQRTSGQDLLVTLASRQEESCPDIQLRSLDVVVRGRALILDEMTSRRRVIADVTDATGVALVKELSDASARLAMLVVRGPGDGGSAPYSDAVEQARQARREAEGKLAKYSAAFRKDLAYRQIGVREVMAAIPPASAVVAYVTYVPASLDRAPSLSRTQEPESEYAAYVLRGDRSRPVLVGLGAAADIDRLVSAWHQTITSEALAAGRNLKSVETANRTAGKELRRVVWDPLAVHVTGVERLYLVPDGALHLVNFAALPVGETQYLVENRPRIHYLSSERDLLMEMPMSGGGRLLALGAPDFDSQEPDTAPGGDGVRVAQTQGVETDIVYRGPRSACGSFQAMHFEPLPATSQEVAEVLDLWQQNTTTGEDDAVLLTGSSASESAFKRQASGNRVLHLATHGFFLGGDCGSVLDPDTTGATRETPLLLSGLVMAGANHRGAVGPDEDDGILTAEEIATLDLRDTEWAVLSACDTGKGEIRTGEGVFGLQRAFRLAGARTTIMSLWPIEDDVTRQWMTALYRNHFGDGKTTVEAVHSASLEILRQRRAQDLSTHPFYWAGFIASGDWR